MELEDVGEGRGSLQVSVDYGDNGELDLDYGDLMAEAEQEPETTPLHHATAAYDDSPPLRLVAKATSSSKSHQGICPAVKASQTPAGAGQNLQRQGQRQQQQQEITGSCHNHMPLQCIALICQSVSALALNSSPANAAFVQPATAAQLSLYLKHPAYPLQPHPMSVCLLTSTHTAQAVQQQAEAMSSLPSLSFGEYLVGSQHSSKSCLGDSLSSRSMSGSHCSQTNESEGIHSVTNIQLGCWAAAVKQVAAAAASPAAARKVCIVICHTQPNICPRQVQAYSSAGQ